MNDKVDINGTFTLEGQEMTLLYAFMEGRTLMVDYMNNSTGEIHSIPSHNLEDETSIEICRQFELATNIECDFRNV